jgi:hypothetical protein
VPSGRPVAASIAAAAACALSIAAQTAPAPHFIDGTFSLRRGATTFVRVRIDIPSGTYVPAETRGTLTGSRLEIFSAGILNRELPTYPAPTPVLLPGSGQAILAYSGSIEIGLPLRVAPGVSGARDVRLFFTYQTCSRRRCEPVATVESPRSAVVEEPPSLEVSLAFRLDPSRVVVPVAGEVPAAEPPEVQPKPMSARFAAPFASFPRDAVPRDRFGTASQVGNTWTILSSAHTYRGIVEEQGFVTDGCGNPGSLAIAMTVPALAREPAKYFLATTTPGAAIPPSRIAPVALTDAQRTTLEGVLDRQFRITYPTIVAPPSRGDGRVVEDRRTPAQRAISLRYDRAFELGRTRLSYDVQAFRLSADRDVQFFVRAAWSADHEAMHMSLWLRLDRNGFTVERTDSWWAHMGRWAPLMFGSGDFRTRILNVVAAVDAGSYIIIGEPGYEGFSVRLYKYAADGFADTGIGSTSGC